MKFLLMAVAAVMLCGCASDRGGMNSSSSEEIGGSSSQRENMRQNHMSDNVKNPGANWNTP